MKALFQRFHRGSAAKDKDKDKDLTPVPKEKFLQLPPLPEWPPPHDLRTTTTSPTSASFKPLPDLSLRPLPSIGDPSFSLFPTEPSFQPTLQSPSTPRQNPTTSPSLPFKPHSFDHPPPTVEPIARTSSSRTEHDSTTNPNGPISRQTTDASSTPPTAVNHIDPYKKVAFISPVPTPLNVDRNLPDAPTPTPPATAAAAPGGPVKTTLSRFQAVHGKEPRGPTSTVPSASSTDLASNTKVNVKSTRVVTSPYPIKSSDEHTIDHSIRSGTPYSQMSNKSTRILAAASWSETAEDDLVSNLGSRERTRQEVLFEILASEERYVQELIKMKDTFIEPLLHPFSTSPLSSPRMLDYDDYSRLESPPLESNESLPPIAARFMSPSPFRADTPVTITATLARKAGDTYKDTPNIDGDSLETDDDDEADDHVASRGFPSARKTPTQAAKHTHPRSPYRSNGPMRTPEKTSVPFPSRSHQNLSPRMQPLSSSTHSLGRQPNSVERERERNHSQGQTSMADPKSPTPASRIMRKLKKSQTRSDNNVFGDALAPHQLPEDLRICLEVVDGGVLEGHRKLSEALRKRYEEQYPLVRSLADVFVANSDIFHGYATYVLHLERALEQVDEALSRTLDKKPKKQDPAEWIKVCSVLRKLEETAVEKGETGLAITLSKPFQRLLKYPLLFQNLLFHTDPSTFEYEATLQMVAEVETIVRSIEDEKIQKEERDKTRDVFARIDGLDKVKQLALPKPSRVLIEERLLASGPNGPAPGSPGTPSSPPVAGSKVKGKSSFKRLSDVLHTGHGIGGKKDLWLVVFNDVVLQCQRTGTTSLPLVAATNARTNSLPELQGKAKYATTGRRNSHTKPRNLYKFLKIQTWAIGEVVQPREGVVAMEEVVRSRAQVHSGIQPKIVPLPTEDEDEAPDSDDSDRKSKMSFSYWGADKVTVQKPVGKLRPGLAGTRRNGTGVPSAYARESSANAKFGTRLVSADHTSPQSRAVSRRTHTPSAGRRPHTSDDPTSHSVKATVTRPAWDTSTRSHGTTTPAAPGKRPRNTSQNSRATTTAPTPKVSLAPSEDSGVGLYRQILEQNPSL